MHYDGLTWLGNHVEVNRIDLGWATKPLDFSQSWVISPSAEGLEKNPGVKIKLSDISGSSSHTGVPVPLAEADARAIKARRRRTQIDARAEAGEATAVACEVMTIGSKNQRGLARPALTFLRVSPASFYRVLELKAK